MTPTVLDEPEIAPSSDRSKARVSGLSPHHRRLRPQAVGVQEMAFGFVVTLLLAFGYALRL